MCISLEAQWYNFGCIFSRFHYTHVGFFEYILDQGVELCVHNLAITWKNEWPQFFDVSSFITQSTFVDTYATMQQRWVEQQLITGRIKDGFYSYRGNKTFRPRIQKCAIKIFRRIRK